MPLYVCVPAFALESCIKMYLCVAIRNQRIEWGIGGVAYEKRWKRAKDALSGVFLKTDTPSSVQNSDPTPKSEEKPIEKPPSSDLCCSRIQVIVVATIGMISLILLLMAGYFVDLTPEFAATVSQFWDFVAACVGFLVSCGKKQ